MNTYTKFINGDIVAHNDRVWRVLGREGITDTTHRRYVLQDVLDPYELKLSRVDKMFEVGGSLMG
jgi:hypothetical protein